MSQVRWQLPGPCRDLASGDGPGPSCTNAYPNQR
ncbi:snapalysin family zinc-dependent metalloprotease [Streptomyces gobiensis]|nr:snapalysin family zinc-dependent metalloprotease [Streptomyces gobiensis]